MTLAGRYAGLVLDAPPEYAPPMRSPAPASENDFTSPSVTRIGVSETIGSGIRRVCVQRLDRAIAGLTQSDDRDVGVHTARKSMKRIRAMIRFVRDRVGYEVYRNENVVLRDTARRIAPVRDSAVLVETLDEISERNRTGLKDDAFVDVRERLSDRHWAISRRILDDPQLVAEVVTNLRVARRRFLAWPADVPGASLEVPDRYDAVADGIHRVYRRGRTRMADAYRDRTTFAFHQWRKRVKYLRYQMEALESLWPEVIGAYARSVDELGESLGFEHDLAMLEHTLVHDPSLCPDPEERRLLGALVLHERAVLRHAAAKLGKLVYAEDPEVFVGRVGSYWGASRAG